MGGATLPVGILRDASKVGWNAGALVTLGTPHAAVSFRIDGQWHQLGHRDVVACSSAPGSPGGCALPVNFALRVIDGTANAVYTFRSELPTSFYVLAGGGVYGERTTSAFDGARSSATNFGLNAGVGVRFGGSPLGGFVEVRFHNVFHGSDIGDYAKGGYKPESLRFIPISAGITF
jgi:hypothetical protein